MVLVEEEGISKVTWKHIQFNKVKHSSRISTRLTVHGVEETRLTHQEEVIVEKVTKVVVLIRSLICQKECVTAVDYFMIAINAPQNLGLVKVVASLDTVKSIPPSNTHVPLAPLAKLTYFLHL